MDLADQNCVEEVSALTPEEIATYLKEVDNWQLADGDKKISKEFKFEGFMPAVEFVNEFAKIAEAQNHHPDIELSYGKAVISLSTHSVGGLSVNDFILAAKIDKIVNR